MRISVAGVIVMCIIVASEITTRISILGVIPTRSTRNRNVNGHNSKRNRNAHDFTRRNHSADYFCTRNHSAHFYSGRDHNVHYYSGCERNAHYCNQRTCKAVSSSQRRDVKLNGVVTYQKIIDVQPAVLLDL